VKNKNRQLLFILLLVEFIFFYRNSFEMSEMFFFLWFFIFGTLFAFRFIGSGSSLGVIGAGPKFLTAKMIESMYVKYKGYKTNNNDFSLDLIFVILAVINLILSLVSYYMGR
jgi:hypothetical protein